MSLTDAGVLAFLDHDDVWHPEHLRSLFRALDDEAKRDVAFTATRTFRDGDTVRLEPVPEERATVDIWEGFPWVCPLAISAAVVRRAAFDAVGGFDEGLHGLSDYHFWLRVGRRGPFLSIAAPTCGVRRSPGSQTDSRRAADFITLKARVARDVAAAPLEERRAPSA